MKVRKFIHDPMKLYDDACRIVAERGKHKPDFLLRVTVVKAVLGGMRSADAASLFGVSPASVNSWIRKADEEGFDSLKTKPSPGRSHLLKEEQYKELDEVLQKDAHDFGFDVWTSDSLSEYISETYGIPISSRTACRIMERLRSTRQTP